MPYVSRHPDALQWTLTNSLSCSFVCATRKDASNQSPTVFSSYYSPRRGHGILNKARIWEVVRATSAATSFFEPIKIDGIDYVDGAIGGSNNPMNAMLNEALDLWQTDSKWRLDSNIKCFISIGTGERVPRPLGDSISDIARTLVKNATDCDEVVENFRRQHPNLVEENLFFRFNASNGLDKIGLEQHQRLDEIKSATETYLQQDEVFRSLKYCYQNLRLRRRVCKSMSSRNLFTDGEW